MGQMMQNEGDEDIIGVVGFYPGIRRCQRFPGVGANGLAALMRGQGLGAGRSFGLEISRVPRVEPGMDQLLFFRFDRGELLFERAEPAG